MISASNTLSEFLFTMYSLLLPAFAASAQSVVSDMKINITVGERTFIANLVANTATAALMSHLQNAPVSYTSSSYGNFETVGSPGFSLPTSNQSIATQAGDIMLYQGNQICIFYGSNSWSYTRLGHINDASADELRSLLGNGNITITLSLSNSAGINITAADGNPGTSHDIYTLGGTRLNQPPSRGIYIENGKLKQK